MFDTSRAHRTTDRVADAGATIQDQLSDVKDKASHQAGAALRDAAATVRDAARPALHDASELARERLEMARDLAAPAVHEAVDRARPKVEAAQSTIRENVLPVVSAAITTAAAGLADAKEEAAPYVEQVRESAHVGNVRARDALKVLKGEATIKERKRSSKGKWLIGVGLLAAAVAAVAAFRQKQQADDPWATPLTDAGATPSLKDRAAEKVAGLTDAKDHTGELDEADLLGGDASGTAPIGVAEPVESAQGIGVDGGPNAHMDADQVAVDELDAGTPDDGAPEDEGGRGV